MQEPNPLQSPTIESRAFIWLLVVVTLAFGLIIWPFSGAVLWALFIAIVFTPLQRRLNRRWPNRPNLAALLTLAIIVVIVILPTALITASLAQQASGLYERVRTGELNVTQYFQRMVDVLPGWLHQLLDRFGLGNLGALQQKLTEALTRSGQALTTHVFTIGQNTLEFVVSFFIMLYLLYFLLRDGPQLAADIGAAVPLNPQHRRRLFSKFVTVVRATVKGNILVAMIQGALGGIAFAVLGIPGAMLWGTIMAFLSLLPAVGAALVWGPVAVYFLATGDILQAIGLTAWGVLAIGLVDNLLRPFLVGKDTKMPDYLVLLSTVGGMAIFGINGFVVGPVIAAMFIAAWDIFTVARLEPTVETTPGDDTGHSG
jgi:predicted PurR-regulated permease PerM